MVAAPTALTEGVLVDILLLVTEKNDCNLREPLHPTVFCEFNWIRTGSFGVPKHQSGQK
jgi:hypothetical protein